MIWNDRCNNDTEVHQCSLDPIGRLSCLCVVLTNHLRLSVALAPPPAAFACRERRRCAALVRRRSGPLFVCYPCFLRVSGSHPSVCQGLCADRKPTVTCVHGALNLFPPARHEPREAAAGRVSSTHDHVGESLQRPRSQLLHQILHLWIQHPVLGEQLCVGDVCYYQ